PEVWGHDPLLETFLDIGVRVNDRRMDERGALAGQELVEVRADGAARACVAERVTRGAAVVGEDLLARGEVRAAAATATATGGGGGLGLLGHPGVEVLLRVDVRRLAHERVAEAAQLRADHRVGLL